MPCIRTRGFEPHSSHFMFSNSNTTNNFHFKKTIQLKTATADLAQLVERRPFKPVAVGSSPTVGILIYGIFLLKLFYSKTPFRVFAPLAQSVERGSNKPKVNSSILLWSTKCIDTQAVNGAPFKLECVMLRGFKSHSIH